jgi:hypothetical protein
MNIRRLANPTAAAANASMVGHCQPESVATVAIGGGPRDTISGHTCSSASRPPNNAYQLKKSATAANAKLLSASALPVRAMSKIYMVLDSDFRAVPRLPR